MEYDFLLASCIFLSAAVIVVPIAKLTGLGSILGYLIAGVIIGPYALGLVSDPQTILHFSEFGVVMMLFLIGLELQPREFWNMRVRLIGLGIPQVLLTAIAIAAVAVWFTVPWQSAIILGLGLALSSTAIVLKLIDERGIMQRSVGRSAFSVLLVQDVAIIPILAIIPFLAIPELVSYSADDGHSVAAVSETSWQAGWRVALVFSVMYLVGRYLLRPIIRMIAKAGIREIFTAFSLLLVVVSALLMNWINLSPALGAFMVGVILADSEYRHELETNLEPFKALFLGLFFISVGMSIQFSILTEHTGLIFGMLFGLAAIKMIVLFVLAYVFKFHIADKFLFAFLLSQGGEFAFVLFQFAPTVGAMDPFLADLLNVTVALSMILTPILLIIFDRIIAPHLKALQSNDREDDDIAVQNNVIILGYGRFGQIVTRLLSAQGFDTTLIDHDPEQIELVKKFDTKVFFGDARRHELLTSAGAHRAEMLVICIHNPETVSEIARMAQKHFPNLKIMARARDRYHAFDLMDIGIQGFERDTFHSALNLGIKALRELGRTEVQAGRIAKAFAKHDIEMLYEAYELRHDDEAMIGHVRTAREVLAQLLHKDLEELELELELAKDENKR